ncbi:MAG: lactococcin 972 family bacteriocin [Coriobacteriia bacterium]|nr:lactococcin 972 family bacteriocin [Coriobacteriia bacterium]
MEAIQKRPKIQRMAAVIMLSLVLAFSGSAIALDKAYATVVSRGGGVWEYYSGKNSYHAWVYSYYYHKSKKHSATAIVIYKNKVVYNQRSTAKANTWARAGTFKPKSNTAFYNGKKQAYWNCW